MKSEENNTIAIIDIDWNSGECAVCNMLADTEKESITTWSGFLDKVLKNGLICHADMTRIAESFEFEELKRRIREEGSFHVMLRAKLKNGVEWLTAFVSMNEGEDLSGKTIHIQIQNQNIFQLNGNYEKDDFLREVLFDGFGQCFMNMIYIDVLNDSYVVQNTYGNDSMQELLIQPVGTYTDDNIGYAKNFVHEGDWDIFYKYTSLDYFRKHLNQKGKNQTFRIRHIKNGEFCPVEVNEVCMKCEKDHFHILYFLRDLTPNNNENSEAEVKDRVLSQITRILYGYNLTVDLCTGKYTVIVGNGLDDVAEKLMKENQFENVENIILGLVRADYRERVRNLVSFNSLQSNSEKSGLLGTIEFPVVYPEKEEWHEFNVFIGVNENGKTVANILVRNITEAHDEKVKRERELKEAERATAANKAKTDFLSKMSHDIRTPLNGIMGLLEMDERHPNDRKLIEANREKMKIAANHLNSLLNDILQLSKLESGNVELSHEVFDLNALAADIITMAAIEASERGIAFYHGDCSGNLVSPVVYGSPLHLRQIFLNIFSNAIKYNKPGGSISCKAECKSIDEKTATYSCTISDTGIGMSKEFAEHIFEPFSQERNDARSTYQGTGLGMAIVKSLVDKMGGTIEIESTEGEGSTFIVTIPFEIADVSEIKNEVKEEEASIQNLHILLVEDNELNMEIAQFLLEDAGAVVTKAFNGKQAVDLFAKNPAGTFDVILMDVMMPVMSGIEATKAIRLMDRSDARVIPVIAMTANAFEEDRQATKNAGMNEHLAKPLDGKEVLRVISKCSLR